MINIKTFTMFAIYIYKKKKEKKAIVLTKV